MELMMILLLMYPASYSKRVLVLLVGVLISVVKRGVTRFGGCTTWKVSFLGRLQTKFLRWRWFRRLSRMEKFELLLKKMAEMYALIELHR
jgi:hypothetical protein